jgi:serralysin
MQNDIYGTNASDILSGTALNDEIIGRDGDDLLSGLDGNDELYGGAGNDTLIGGTGNDELHGGTGADLFVYDSGRDNIEDFSLAQGDRIRIAQNLGVTDLAGLLARAVSTDGGDDTLIDFGNGNTLLLEDVRLSSLVAEMFEFEAVTPPPDTPP